MVCAKMRLATSIIAALPLLRPSAAAAIQDVPEDTVASGPSVYRAVSDVILVSNEPWKEEHSTFARWTGRPMTTWSVENLAHPDNLSAVLSRGIKPVLLALFPSEKPPTREILDVTWLSCPAWHLLPYIPDVLTTPHNTRLARPQSECKSGHITANQSSIESFFWSQGSSTNFGTGFRSRLGELAPLKRHNMQDLGGRELVVACLKQLPEKSTEYTCEDTSAMAIFNLLKQKNVTVKRLEAFKQSELAGELMVYANIAVSPFYVDYLLVSFVYFPLTRVVHDTFYSRVDPHRVVSLAEVARGCWKLVAATITLLMLVVFISLITGNKEENISRRISDSGFFLLAAVLATSTVQTSIVRRAGLVRKTLLGLWIAALLPLSVYFRTELTTIVTLRRPADRIDTLQKLEDALDRRQVAPCVVENTLGHNELAFDSTSFPQQSLSKKLQSEFARYGEDELVKKGVSDCIECASRPDRVCYASYWRHPSSSLLRLGSVGAFVEDMKIELVSVATPKHEWSYWPLRSFFLAVEEHQLIDWDSKEPEYESRKVDFDVSGLLKLLVILHAISCLVLGLEVVAARYMRRE